MYSKKVVTLALLLLFTCQGSIIGDDPSSVSTLPQYESFNKLPGNDGNTYDTSPSSPYESFEKLPGDEETYQPNYDYYNSYPYFYSYPYSYQYNPYAGNRRQEDQHEEHRQEFQEQSYRREDHPRVYGHARSTVHAGVHHSSGGHGSGGHNSGGHR